MNRSYEKRWRDWLANVSSRAAAVMRGTMTPRNARRGNERDFDMIERAAFCASYELECAYLDSLTFRLGRWRRPPLRGPRSIPYL